MVTTYVLLTVISIVLIVVAVFLGKKIRDAKDAAYAKKAQAVEEKKDAV